MLGVPDGKLEWILPSRLVRFVDGKGASLGRRRPRGGICWPKMVARGFGGGGVEGFMVVLMENPDDGLVWVAMERKFEVVDDLLRDGAVEREGICRWFGKAYELCGCETWYCMTEAQTNMRYQLQVLRSGWVKGNPGFVNLEFADASQAEHCLFEWMGVGRLKYQRNGEIHKALRSHVVGRGLAEASPAVTALMAGVAGMERFPCRG